MKTLSQYIDEKLIIIPSQVNERLIINKNYKRTYTCVPKSFDELREIIEQRYEEQGPGTEQNPIDLNDIAISNVDSFYKGNMGIFEGTKKFEYIDISEWDVSNVKNMKKMFFDCWKLKSVGDLSNWDVSNVEDMRGMFCYCRGLKSVGDLSKWDISNVKDTHCMFYCCEKLESVGDLSNWDVSNVNDMYGMFYKSRITKTPSWYKE